jgi:glucan 1,4-alpha-glucosidase
MLEQSVVPVPRSRALRRTARSTLVALVSVGLALAGAVPGAVAAGSSRADVAPGSPGATSSWTTGAKQGVGTATSTRSKVWYTLSDGVLSEVYYPRVDVANSRALELIVTDGSTFADRESVDTTHRVELVDSRSLTYRQVNTDKQKRYEVTKTYVTDPRRSTVLIRVSLRSLDGGKYQVFAQFDPSLANSGKHDSAARSGSALVATDATGDTPVSSALLADRSFSATSNGYAGESDGWSDLADDFDLDHHYATAPDGNVVQTAQLKLTKVGRSSVGTLALAFGDTAKAATSTAAASLKRPFALSAVEYALGWHRYLADIDRAPASVRRDRELATQYSVAAMTLKAHEDKTYRGANIASLTIPWGEAQNADEAGIGGYHLVWSRDLYQVATAQMAIGDEAAAGRSLGYLFDVQQKPDGSFPQNSELDGTPYWGSLQLDEVAFPIVLAWQLGRDDAATWEDHVKKAADFLVARGPSTPQERWEEEGGYSPSTIAAEIAGLVSAAAIADANGDAASADLYRGVADEWQRSVEEWTVTSTGPLGDGEYYLRINADTDPDDGDTLDINNGGGAWDEREIVDAGFLELVRLGVKPADDAAVAGSLPEVDSTISVDTPNGTMWYRYNHDGYGEKADGSPYDGTGVGRLWPLLSGERGEYELANGRPATSYLRTMANAANDGYLIPEQVWDTADDAAHGLEFGEGTGSATPLSWSMAQFVRLAQSIDEGAPIETPEVVADRYADGTLPAGPALELTAPEADAVTDAGTIRVAGTTDAGQIVVRTGAETLETDVSGGTFELNVPVSTGTNTITVVAVGADGGTSVEQRTITSTNFGTAVGEVDDPQGDDRGPGSYVYPTNDAFVDGAFDLTHVGVFDAGDSYNFVATIDGPITNPWGGDQISVQRLDYYVALDADGGTVAAAPGSNAALEHPYDFRISGSGFLTPTVTDAAGTVLGQGSILALPSTRQIAFIVPKDAFGAEDLGDDLLAVTMASHADAGEGVGNIRPVYSLPYWASTGGTGMSWIQEYRFGGGAGEYTDANATRDTDTSDPNLIDIVVPEGASQAEVLDPANGVPVAVPYVSLR